MGGRERCEEYCMRVQSVHIESYSGPMSCDSPCHLFFLISFLLHSLISSNFPLLSFTMALISSFPLSFLFSLLFPFPSSILYSFLPSYYFLISSSPLLFLFYAIFSPFLACLFISSLLSCSSLFHVIYSFYFPILTLRSLHYLSK